MCGLRKLCKLLITQRDIVLARHRPQKSAASCRIRSKDVLGGLHHEYWLEKSPHDPGPSFCLVLAPRFRATEFPSQWHWRRRELNRFPNWDGRRDRTAMKSFPSEAPVLCVLEFVPQRELHDAGLCQQAAICAEGVRRLQQGRNGRS